MNNFNNTDNIKNKANDTNTVRSKKKGVGTNFNFKSINVPYKKEFELSTSNSRYQKWQIEEKVKESKKKTTKELQSLYSTYTRLQLQSLEQDKRIVIIMDIDDVMINSLETVIDIINEDLKEELITVQDVKTWDFQVVLRKIAKSNNKHKHLYTKKQDIIHIFDEDERFQQRVQLKQEWKDFFADKDNHEQISILFFTQGAHNNIDFKFNYLKEKLDIDFTYSFNILNTDELATTKESKKSQIPCNYLGISNELIKTDFLQNSKDLKNIIQIDDNYKNLRNSKCGFKILLANERETDFNKVSDNDTHTYKASNTKEVIEILNFLIKNKDFLDTEYSG